MRWPPDSSIEYVVSAADAHSTANVGRDTEASTALIPEIAALAHDHGATVEVIVATAWDCPFDGPTDPQRVERVVAAGVAAGADRIAIADTIGTATPGASSRSSNGSAPYRRPAAGRALPQHPGTGLASAWRRGDGGHHAAGRVDWRPRRLPVRTGASGNIATEDPCTYCATAGTRSTWIRTPPLRPRLSQNA